jgi:uncharacterized protein with PIN domain
VAIRSLSSIIGEGRTSTGVLGVGEWMDGKLRFVADAMMGRLARWLRVMGYDVLYGPRYDPEVTDRLVAEGRILLSRGRDIIERYETAVLLTADRVGGQLLELKHRLHLSPDPADWFTRCIRCNRPLERAPHERAREGVPDYVFQQAGPDIRFCPSCGRFFWPGSHRERMLRQLETWGFGPEALDP